VLKRAPHWSPMGSPRFMKPIPVRFLKLFRFPIIILYAFLISLCRAKFIRLLEMTALIIYIYIYIYIYCEE
jgi:hypothetical protein